MTTREMPAHVHEQREREQRLLGKAGWKGNNAKQKQSPLLILLLNDKLVLQLLYACIRRATK